MLDDQTAADASQASLQPTSSRTPEIDWDDLRFFHAVAKEGSLSRAAARIGVTQPTVGRRVKELEARLRCRLFDRLATGYRLTPCGKRAYERAGKLAAMVEEIAAETQGEAEAVGGVVRVTAPDGIGVNWLAPRIAALRRLHPRLTVALDVSTGRRCLHSGEADIALRMGDPGSDDLVGRRIAHAPFHLYASEDYIAAANAPRAIEELERHQVIDGGGPLADLPQVRLLRDIGADVGASTAASVDSILGQASLLTAGAGLVSLPSYLAEKTSGVVRVLADGFGISMPVWLLTRRDLRETARVRTVLRFIRDEARASLPQAPI